MAKQISAEAWSGFIGRLRQENYSGIAAELNHALKLKPEINSISLKAFLLKAADDYIEQQKKKIKPHKLMIDHEIILVALGLLEGYCGDIDGIEGVSLTEVMEVGERRIKYLKTGPYLRIKRGKRYSSYDTITSDKDKNAAKKSLEKRDGRLIENGLAVYIADIPDIGDYIKQSKQNYEKNRILKLPTQCCFLEKYPIPADPNTLAVPVESEDNEPDDTVVEPTPAPLNLNWGDSIKGRPFYTLEEIDAGALDGIFAFNSIKNSTIGDEKNFVGARVNTGVNAGKNNGWCISEIKVQHSAEYIVRLYVHGSNKYGTDSIASNVKVAFNIPAETAKCIKITGFLFANNAHPNQYWSSVAFVSDIPFHLEYIYGSALIENNGVGKNGGKKLSDEIVTKAASNHGTYIGYSQLDGRVPTSYQYASYITIRVKAVFDVPFLIEGKVRIDGSVDWAQSVKVRTGTILDFQFYYKNISGSTQDNVMLQCKLPSNLHYVAGSTKIFNTKCDDGALSEGITTTGVNIGNYTPSSDAYVRFTVEVVDDNLADGWNKLITWIKCSADQLVRQEPISIGVKK